MNSTAAIVEDAQGNAELQVTVHTLIRESKRRSVLMSAGMAHLMHLEEMIAKMENAAVEQLFDQIKQMEAEAAEKGENTIIVPELSEKDTSIPDTSPIINPSDPTPNAHDLMGEAAKAMARSVDYPSTSQIGFNQ